jgi:hypothetical protein
LAHIEILVEDVSGKRALEILVPKILGSDCSFRIHSYKGIGHLPKNMKGPDPAKRLLLANLPRLLQGYGRTFAEQGYEGVVIVVCDLDDRNQATFLANLNRILRDCQPRPPAHFCLAIEEGEAWFLGDRSAIMAAFPRAKTGVLNSYAQDSICGTWEILANALYPRGLKALTKNGYHITGVEKSRWAIEIAPHMDVDKNQSPSFCSFRNELRAV